MQLEEGGGRKMGEREGITKKKKKEMDERELITPKMFQSLTFQCSSNARVFGHVVFCFTVFNYK